MSVRQSKQRGASAIEFAFVLPILLAILYGIVTFGEIFYTQMSITRAAADGARVLRQMPKIDETPDVPQAAQDFVVADTLFALANSIVSGVLGAGTTQERMQRLTSQGITVTVGAGDCDGAHLRNTRFVRISYPYGAIRMLPAITLPMVGRLVDGPLTLGACAATAL